MYTLKLDAQQFALACSKLTLVNKIKIPWLQFRLMTGLGCLRIDSVARTNSYIDWTLPDVGLLFRALKSSCMSGFTSKILQPQSLDSSTAGSFSYLFAVAFSCFLYDKCK